MTLKDIKAEIREEFEATNPRCVLQDGHLYFRQEDVIGFLNTALSRVAEETKKAIVPGELLLSNRTVPFPGPEHEMEIARTNSIVGHNSCRSQALENYKQFTQEV
jgi:hypothetical protein